MICHKHKCIFIHIPRCAGTSMELSIVGDNWWRVEKTTKHLIASTAKKIYEPYWNDYFKFSFVRNPWDRMVSMSSFPGFYGVNLHQGGEIDFSNYFKKWPDIEVDPRSKSKNGKFDPVKNAVYLNILNEEIDFIGRLENLQEDFDTVCDSIGKPRETLPHNGKSKNKHYTEYYNEETKQIVAEKYRKDIKHFGYKFGE